MLDTSNLQAHRCSLHCKKCKLLFATVLKASSEGGAVHGAVNFVAFHGRISLALALLLKMASVLSCILPPSFRH